MADVDEIEQPVRWRLTLTVAGPNFRDIIELEDEDRLTLQPTHEDVNGLSYERYQGDTPDEWVEVRFDYIVARELEAVYAEPEQAEPDELDPDAGAELPAELRVRGEET